DIVAIKPAFSAIGEGRGHGMAIPIEDPPGERRAGHFPAGASPSPGILVETCLHGVKQRRIDEGVMKAGIKCTLMRHLTEIDPVAQEMKEGAAAERAPADAFA